MKNDDIDGILANAAPHEVDPALLGRVTASMGASMGPVRPMAAPWMLASALLLICILIAVAGAFAFRVNGIPNLSAAEMAVIFAVLGIFLWFAALISAGEMVPGRKRPLNGLLSPTLLLVVVTAGFLAMDAVLFRDYGMDSFASQGIPCLRAGLVVAAPTGIASWLVLRRGFAVNRTAAGLAAGTLAGLAGLTMLEIHCPNFHASHIMVWHTGVIPISALVGAILARRFK